MQSRLAPRHTDCRSLNSWKRVEIMLVLRASLFASYISNSETKELIHGMWNTGHKLNLFVLLILRGISERNGRPWRSWAGDIEVIRCGTRVPTLDLFMLKLCFRVLLHRF